MTQPRAAAPIDERILASGTTVRFVQMMALMLMATAGLATLVNFGTSLSWGCYSAAGLFPRDVDVSGLVGTSHPAMEQCFDRYGSEQSPLFIVVWPAVLAVATVAQFLAMPRWRTRRRSGLAEPEGALAEHLDRLRRRSGLERMPRILIDARRTNSANAVVFGSDRRPTVRLDAGLRILRERDPADFEAIMLHEFAHIANRDITVTYLTVTMWRAFVFVVALPFAVRQIVALLGLLDSVALEIELAFALRHLALAAVAVLVVHFARAEVLRSRELYADRTAKRAKAKLRPLFERASRPEHGRMRGTLGSLRHSHPSPRARLAALDRPKALFHVHPALVFTTGVAAVVIAQQFTAFLRVFWPHRPDEIHLMSVLMAAALVTAVVGTALWRAAVWAAIHPGDAASGVRPGLWLGTGMVVGQLVQDGVNLSGWFPPQPAVLLLLVALGVLFCWWTTQTARIWAGLWRGRSMLPVMAPILIGGALALTAALFWWQSHGTTWALGLQFDPEGIARFLTHGPSYVGLDEHPRIAWIIGAFAPLLINLFTGPLLWIAVSLCWTVPFSAWLLRANPAAPLWALGAPAPSKTDLPSLRRLAWATALGGGTALLGAVVSTLWIHDWSPPNADPRALETLVYSIWASAAIVLGAGVAAAVAVAPRGRYRLVSALIASQGATVLGFIAALAVMTVDGCTGGGVVEDRCGTEAFVAFWDLLVLGSGTVIVAGLAVAVAIAAVAGVASRLRRGSETVTVSGTRTSLRARPMVAAVCALALGFGAGASAGQLRHFFPPEVSDAQSRPSTGYGERYSHLLAPPNDQELTENEQAMLVGSWWAYGGSEVIDGLYDALEFLPQHMEAGLMGTRSEAAPLRASCEDLASAVTEAEEFFPIPDEAMQLRWQSSLEYLGDAATACVYGVDQGNSPLLNASIADLHAGVMGLEVVLTAFGREALVLDLEPA